MKNKKNIAIIFTVFFVLTLVLSCAKNKTALQYRYNRQASPAFTYPDASFAVISDLHIYDTSLGVSGAAFEKTMNSDRKLLLDSIDLLDYALESIVNRGVSFVLISGDLTKDGELVNHLLMAEKLGKLADAGIAAYVITGNHDINNPGAVRYEGDGSAPIPSINADDFARIYGDFGYNAALMRDIDSLSYVAEPVPGLWLLAIDSCRYRENKPGEEEIVSGKISQKTADWIGSVLEDAKSKNKAVMVMIHHGILESWNGKAILHPEYLLEDFANFGKFLSSWDVKFGFSGHYHAQDITRGDFDGGKYLYEIETGSLITAPCPVRYINIKNNALDICTETLVDKLHPDTDFAANAHAFVKKTVMLEAFSVLRRYKVSVKDADYIADAVGDAFVAHYGGDENPALRSAFDKKKLGLWGRFVYDQQKYALDGLWVDKYPADNNVLIEL